MIKLKEEKGAITILVLITMLFFISFLVVTYIFISNKAATQMEATKRIRDVYEGEDASRVFYKFFGGIEESLVPPEYQQLEYIESTGTQYIDTNYIPKSTDTTECKVAYNSSTKCDNSFYGANPFIAFTSYTTAPSGCRQRWNNTQYDFTLENYSVPHVRKQEKNKFYLDGELVKTYTSSEWVANYSALLFARNSSSGKAEEKISGKIYYCKIWDNGELVRNFIPCYRRSDNVAGLYDTVNGIFYTNLGTGEFIKGPKAFSSNSNVVIPIYTVEQLLKIGSGEFIKIDEVGGKHFLFSNEATYILMNDLSFEASKWSHLLNGKDWLAVGDNVNLIGGFEGNGHKITVAKLSGSTYIYSIENEFAEKKFVTENFLYTFKNGVATITGLSEKGQEKILDEVVKLAMPDTVVDPATSIECTITEIAANAFKNKTNFDIESLPSGLTTIGANAFSGCISLTLKSIPDSVTSLGSGAFYGCTELTEMKLSDTINKINDTMFYKCSNLKTVTLPDGITAIGTNAFYGCTNLSITSLPSKVTSIGSSTFRGCTNLALTSLPSGITSIGDYAFNSCSSLALTSLPSGLKTIGYTTFSGCTNLALTSLPEGLTKIGYQGFKGCSNITLTSLPENVTIEAGAFSGCTNLALTSLPSSLTSIAGSTFSGCANLALTSLPSGLTSIGESAFSGCTNLALTSLPSGLTSIANYAFQNCTNLALTSLPSGLTSIGGAAFQKCTNITLTSLPSGLTNLGGTAFDGCIKLALTSIPSGITNIGSYTFRNCTNLTTIELPNGITNIGTSAFTGCTNLTINYAGKRAEWNAIPKGTNAIPKNATINCADD